jgi:hypothetical protein
MNSKQWFGLFLRIVGVLGIIIIVRHTLQLPAACAMPGFLFVLIKRVIGVLVGLYLIRGGPLLVKFAYPDQSDQPKP